MGSKFNLWRMGFDSQSIYPLPPTSSGRLVMHLYAVFVAVWVAVCGAVCGAVCYYRVSAPVFHVSRTSCLVICMKCVLQCVLQCVYVTVCGAVWECMKCVLQCVLQCVYVTVCGAVWEYYDWHTRSVRFPVVFNFLVKTGPQGRGAFMMMIAFIFTLGEIM